MQLYRCLQAAHDAVSRSFLFALSLMPLSALAQQVPDSAFTVAIEQPAFPPGEGPLVLIDEGHHNFHTKDYRYRAFANVLEADGFRVGSHAGSFENGLPQEARILVISNALHRSALGNWVKPVASAFTPAEIGALKDWVSEGGSLFLIADHMPMAGAAAGLAAAFGFGFTDGFAMDTTTQGPSRFSRTDGTLRDSPVSPGGDSEDGFEAVLSFTGQAFTAPETADPVLVFGDHFMNFMPDTAWRFRPETPVEPATGMLQGAVMDFGAGKLAVFGEAAMFSSQLAGPNRVPVGMSSRGAGGNVQLLLNIVRWLAG